MIGVVRRRVMGRGSAPLPYDAEIEYLEGTGTQYVDSSIGASTTLNIILNFALTSDYTYANSSFILGCYSLSCVYSVAVPSENNIRVPNSGNFTNLSCVISNNGVSHLLSYKFGAIYLDGDSIGTYSGKLTESLPIRLFGRYRTAASQSKITGGIRIYSCKMIDGTLVRDFIPVRVGTVGYLYDRVSGQLFGNSGTGDFVLGQDV